MAYISRDSAFETGSGLFVDTLTNGPDFTAGTSSQVTLSASPASENSVWVYFDGIAQHHSEYTVSGSVVSFNEVIPVSTETIEVQSNIQVEIGVPGELTVDYGKLTTSAITSLLRKNVIINGGFNIWQRGTSQTTTGFGCDDRWSNDNTGTTKTASRQAFALGQTEVPGNPMYFSRTTVTSVAGASNYALKTQKIESVHTLAGETITLSFYAKADANKNIASEFIQGFGTGGSPSAINLELGITTYNLTTAWQKFTLTTTVPSITGKTLGTDNNDYFRVVFWLDSGSTYDSRNNTLGQQSGTFEIAQVQIEEGDTATDFERRLPGEELALCQRYYETGFLTIFNQEPLHSSSRDVYQVFFAQAKRAVPVMALTDNASNAGKVTIYSATNAATTDNITSLTGNVSTNAFYGGKNQTTNSYGVVFYWEADAEL